MIFNIKQAWGRGDPLLHLPLSALNVQKNNEKTVFGKKKICQILKSGLTGRWIGDHILYSNRIAAVSVPSALLNSQIAEILSGKHSSELLM